MYLLKCISLDSTCKRLIDALSTFHYHIAPIHQKQAKRKQTSQHLSKLHRLLTIYFSLSVTRQSVTLKRRRVSLINIYLSFIYLFLSLFFYLICIFSLGIIQSLFTSKLVSRNFSRYTANVNRHTEQHLWHLFSSGISSMAHHTEIRSQWVNTRLAPGRKKLGR